MYSMICVICEDFFVAKVNYEIWGKFDIYFDIQLSSTVSRLRCLSKCVNFSTCMRLSKQLFVIRSSKSF